MVERLLLPTSAREGRRRRISDQSDGPHLRRNVRGPPQRHRRQRLGARQALFGECLQCALRTVAAAGYGPFATARGPIVAGELSALASRPGNTGAVRPASLRGAAAGAATQEEEAKKEAVIIKLKASIDKTDTMESQQTMCEYIVKDFNAKI